MCYGTEQFSTEARNGIRHNEEKAGNEMKVGLRMAGVGVALLAGLASTGTTVFASTASTSSTAATVASWDRGGGDHNGGDRGSDHNGGDRGGDHNRGDRGGDRGHDWGGDRHSEGDHRSGDGEHRGDWNRCNRDREFRWNWNC
jgi:hypothetical protein